MANIYDIDLVTIKERFKEFVKTSTDFTDYNFEGSAISQFLDLGAFIAHYPLVFLNMAVNEMYMPTTQIFLNAYKQASMLNYLPKRKSAPYITVTLQKSAESATVVIPKYSNFKMGDNINLVNIEQITLSTADPVNVELYEGSIVEETVEATGIGFQMITLENGYNDVDDNIFYVYVDVPNGSGGYTTSDESWINVSKDGIPNTTKCFYTIFTDKFYIKFDNGRIFDKPLLDEQIRVVYLKTNGELYNSSTSSTFEILDAVTNKENVTISTADVLKNGTDEEELESIKNNAPLFFTTQGRAITESDYNIIMKRYSGYQNFNDGVAWGGEKEFLDASNDIVEELAGVVRDLGHVYISAIKEDFSYLTTQEQTDFINFFNSVKIISIFLKFSHPNIVYINPSVSVKYKSIVGLDTSTVESDINNYLATFIGFNKTFNKSNFAAFVDGLNAVSYSSVDYALTVKVKNEAYKVIRLNGAVVADSLSGTVNSLPLTSSGGVISWNSLTVGSINEATGFIILENDFGVSDYELSFQFVDDKSITFEKDTLLNYNDVTLTTI